MSIDALLWIYILGSFFTIASLAIVFMYNSMANKTQYSFVEHLIYILSSWIGLVILLSNVLEERRLNKRNKKW